MLQVQQIFKPWSRSWESFSHFKIISFWSRQRTRTPFPCFFPPPLGGWYWQKGEAAWFVVLWKETGMQTSGWISSWWKMWPAHLRGGMAWQREGEKHYINVELPNHSWDSTAEEIWAWHLLSASGAASKELSRLAPTGGSNMTDPTPEIESGLSPSAQHARGLERLFCKGGSFRRFNKCFLCLARAGTCS